MRITFNEGFSNTPVIFADWKDFVIAQVQLGKGAFPISRNSV